MPGLAVPRSLPTDAARACLLAGLLVCLPASPNRAASLSAARGTQGMVVTPEAHATAVGLDVLRGGGNAADAAVAIAFALAVTDPYAGSIGGGGFLLYRSPQATFTALDFRETAPRGIRAEMFLDEEGRPVPGLSLRGGLAVGVPGSVAGLAEAHRRWGSRPWSKLIAPAVRLAEAGFPVSRWLAETLASSGAHLKEDAAARAIFAPNGAFPDAGERLVQKDLAACLRRIARRGTAAFYDGPTAQALVQTIRARGGVMEARDLTAYRCLEREPVEGHYRGYRVVSFPPPSSGGVALLQILGMLEQFDLSESGPGSSLTVHRMVEAERRAFADRARWLGDPDYFDVPLRRLLDSEYLAERAGTIRPDQATPSHQVLAGDFAAPEADHTLHFSVADRQGGAVALTTTLNGAFGSGIVASGTGIVLNNEMDDFALAPGVPNLYGLVGGEANALAGGKRPLSSMTPTIVEFPTGEQRPALVLGSPGGPTIITSVLQVLVNVLDFGMPLQEAVDWPRFHHQWLPDSIRHELRAFAADVAAALAARGHHLDPRPDPLGCVNAIGVDDDGTWLGAADPRREGATAAGY